MRDKKINRIICIVLILIAFAAVIKSFVTDYRSGRIPAGDIMQINGEWEMVSQKGKVHTYQYVIPKFTSREMAFSMHNSWTKVQVFLNGREIYAYNDTYREQGEQRAWVEIPADSWGQTLTLKFEGESGLIKRIMKKPMYLGEKNAVFMEWLLTGLYALVFFLVTCIFAVIIFICQVSLKKSISKKNFSEMTYLSLFILDVGVWILTDSQVLQLFFSEAAVISLVSFLTFLLMPVFLLLYIRKIMLYPWKIFDILFRVSMGNVIISMGAYVFRIAPIYMVLILQHLLIMTAIPVILKNGLTEIRKYNSKEMKMVVIGFGLLSFCGVVAFGMFYINSSASYAYVYSIGFILFILCLAWSVFEDIYYYLERSAKASVYRELAYTDVMTGMENRTSFEMMMEETQNVRGYTYIMFDNNNLKTINDGYGHQEGDELLIETAECIKGTFERIGRCFRIGGDEFLVILKGMSEKDVKGSLGYFDRKVAEANKSRTIDIEVAYGYFICQDESMTAKELFEHADERMYSKKRAMR